MQRFLASATLLLFLAPVLPAQSPVTRLTPGPDLTISYSFAGKQIPVWSNGALVAIENNGGIPAFYGFDKSGRYVFSSAFSVPEASKIFVMNWARGKDGALALCGSAWTAEGRGAPFIASISPDGVHSQITRVTPYTPYKITVAADGTLWAAGYELIEGKESLPGVDRNGYVIRQFDPSGKMLNGYIRRSEIQDQIRFSPTQSFLVSSGNRIGWYSYGKAGDGEYIEVSDGQVTRYPLPDFRANNRHGDVNGVAMTETGEVFAVLAPRQSPPRPNYIYALDRNTRSWRTVDQPPGLSNGSPIGLYGAEGRDLVVQQFKPSRITLFHTN